MKRHSDGPWVIQESRDGGATKSIIATDEKGQWVLARVNMGMGSESEANSRLISAAPELLSVLRVVQKRLCEECPSTIPGEPGEHSDECLAAIEAIEKTE